VFEKSAPQNARPRTRCPRETPRVSAPPGGLRRQLAAVAPTLFSQIDALVEHWLRSLLSKLQEGRTTEFRPKQINDPIWGTIELLPWEVALLDTPLLQRMRGVRQLGLAQLVFPSASYDRLEHIIGVVGAVEETVRALSRQIDRWNRDHQANLLPTIDDRDRYALRLAALFHDIGHGPFSHALEPVLEVGSTLGPNLTAPASPDWRAELKLVQDDLRKIYILNKPPAVSEAVAVSMVLSDALTRVLASDRLFTERGRSAEELQEVIIAAIIGGVEGPGASHLSALISSQIDADKLDYLARDAHHAGLEIGFDTDRLLARLEVLRVTPDNVDASAAELRERAGRSDEKVWYQIGIAASGFGSFEQMLIGRTFLYDRLYHHHKVRSAEAMAQRFMLVAEGERGRRFDLGEIYLSVGDDTMLRVFSGEVTHSSISVVKGRASALAQGILNRELLHRAFAFRGRFVASPPGLAEETADQNRQFLWRRIVKDLDGLSARFELGKEIHSLALRCAEAMAQRGIDKNEMEANVGYLEGMGPEQIIVDLPPLKADAIRILARYPNGALKVPEFTFNPVKWSDAYELQKRTGYVFCPREVVRIVGLASKIVFLGRFGVAMAREADGYIKAVQDISLAWLTALLGADLIDRETAAHLSSKRFSLLGVRPEDLRVPQGWIVDDPDVAHHMAAIIGEHLKGGLTADHIDQLGRVLDALYAFVDTWFQSGQVTSDLKDEADLQRQLRDCFGFHKLKTEEGSRVGGGELDLFVADAILVENKFHGRTAEPTKASPAAAMQGRRYAIALSAQIVIVMLAYKPPPGLFPSKPRCVTVHPIGAGEQNRVEIRFSLPYGAVVPSSEKADRSVR
jgi:HD superfamily phosphohydrolase